jgi:DNA repair exonuclease SbcCD ATPase subunit
MLASAAYILYIRRRNKHLQEVLSLSAELQQMSDDEKQLRKDIEQREKDLEKSRRSLEKTSAELSNVKSELQRVNEELSEHEDALKEKERQLSEKMEQNRTFIKLLHQSELEGKAEDVIYAIRQSSAGRKDMSEADWKQLYQAVDQLYPTFHGRVSAELGRGLTKQKMQVCYLMRIGLSNPQIQGMTNLSRVTVWRWVKKFDWVLTNDDESSNAHHNDNNKK